MKKVCAIARIADRLAVVIDRKGESVRVTADSWEFLLNLTLFPNHRLDLEDCWGGWAGWVQRSVFTFPDAQAPVVDPASKPIITAERGEWGHQAVFPHERETYKTG